MTLITWSKSFQRLGDVHSVRQSITRLYNPWPARASKASHIITPQMRIVLRHGDKEIIVASWMIMISCMANPLQDLSRLETMSLTKVSNLSSLRWIVAHALLDKISGGYVRILWCRISTRLSRCEERLNGASPIS